ncbi:MFS transporter [Streptomyces sp. NPDC001642]|uniref:MFS transporter n=1 Tax=Streptomyces sp. NPDC001642 TaxID=3154392 RepID=UPI003325E84A
MTATVPPVPAAVPRLSRNRDFQLLWIGQALSDFGSSMTYIVLPLVLLASGNSTTVAATVGTVSLAVGLVARLPAGYLSDRCDQRALMLGSDLVRLVAVGSLAVYVLLRPVPVALALVTVVVSVAALEVFRPAQSKVIRRIVPTEQLGAALSLNQARAYGADIAAPAAAGLLLALEPSVPLAVDALTFGVSALCVAVVVRAPRRGKGGPDGASSGGDAEAAGPQPVAERFLTRFTAGWRYLAGDRFMRWCVLYGAGLNLAFSALTFALILGVGSRPDGAVAVGTAMSAAAVAGLAGSLLTPFVQRHVSLKATLVAGPATGAVLLAVAGTSGSTIAFVAGFCALCLLIPVISATFGTIMAVAVPEEIYGRVITASGLVAQIVQPCGPLAAGLLLARLSLPTTAAAFAMAFALLAAVPVALPKPPQTSTPASARSLS